MDIKEQQETYAGFVNISVKATIAIVIVMALLAAFVA